MNDRIRACSPLVALAIASVVALSACEQQSPPEPVAKVSGALTALQAGDVAVTCMFTTNDQLQIVPLVPLDVGSDVKYTDREANAAGQFNTGENVDVAYPINSPGDASTIIPAGTVLPFGPAQNFQGGLGDGTEQVFLYQGSVTAMADAGPTYQLLWGMQISPGGIWVATRDDANNLSELPTVLTGFNVALASGTSNNYAYDSTKGTSGTKAQLQAKIANPANWVQGTAAAPVTCPTGFVVIPDVVDSGSGDSAADAPTGTDGAVGTDAGTGGMTGGGDAGVGGMTGTDAAADAGGGTGGMTGNDAAADTGAGGTTVGTGGASGNTDSGASDVKADTGTATDAKADTGTATDAKADTGSTGTDAKVDTGSTKVDAGKDGGTTPKGSSGCSCSTASNGANIGAAAWMLSLVGIVMTVRRRRRR